MRREGTGGRGGRRGRREGELAAKAEDASGKSCLGPKASCSSRGTRPGRCILGLRKTLKRRAHDGKLMQLPVQTPSLGEPADALGLI